ncbi:AAA family ATPase [Candidatus Woesearchaeota archaeon]|nr:AAA family ATPase [Candidatus Woesearchaeota archaeon]
MLKSEIKEILVQQNELKLDQKFIKRDIFSELEKQIKNPFIIIISGIRRCGKSTLLYQLREKYPGYFMNFDDERLIDFSVKDFQKLDEVFHEEFRNKELYYFDEIQNIKAWERFARRLRDNEKKVIVTGSNASMLSRELGTHLTGRYLQITLFPFSFKEFLKFKNIQYDKKSFSLTEKKAELKNSFEEYLKKGGFPEFLKTDNPDYLKLLYDNILYRDIIVRYNLKNEKSMKELLNFIATNVSKEISFNSIKKSLQIKSPTTVKEYFDYLENCYLGFIVPTFKYSLKKRIYSKKKIYLIDTGLANYLGYRFSKDSGRLLENSVFIELKRRRKEIFFHRDNFECDFIIRKGVKITEAFQVCYEIHEENKEREINGLIEALKKFKLKKGLILTLDQSDELKIKNKKIIVKPVWKWLLE